MSSVVCKLHLYSVLFIPSFCKESWSFFRLLKTNSKVNDLMQIMLEYCILMTIQKG